MSPIFIKDFTWNQTENDVYITVRVPGITRVNSDLLVAEKYIKINCRPYIWEIFLQNEINSSKNTAKINVGNSTVVFHLSKKMSGMWDSIEQNKTFDSKDSLVECRLKEINKMSELTLQHKKNICEFRADQQNICREIHQKNLSEMKKEISRQLEIDKFETLSSPNVEHFHVIDEKSTKDSDEIPIRNFTKIQVQFTPKNLK